MDKAKIKEKENRLIELTSTFCQLHIDDEYASLAEKLIRKLGRKRQVPFESGKIEIWAAAVIHALGTINFLFDKSCEPHIRLDEMNAYYGTNPSTVTGKSKTIRDILKLRPFDPDFSTSTMTQHDPMKNMVIINGFLVPLDSIPEDLQKQVKQARMEGRDIQFVTQDEE